MIQDEIVQYLDETTEIVAFLSRARIERLVVELRALRGRGGRLFLLGVGGSSSTASHAVNDFRKILGIEAYAPSDNVAELTARTNDDGWRTVFEEWLRVSRLGSDDAIFVLSVGGGTYRASANLLRAVDYAESVGARVLGVVGRDGGHTERFADACLVIPGVYPKRITSHTEGIASVVMHMLVELCR